MLTQLLGDLDFFSLSRLERAEARGKPEEVSRARPSPRPFPEGEGGIGGFPYVIARFTICLASAMICARCNSLLKLSA